MLVQTSWNEVLHDRQGSNGLPVAILLQCICCAPSCSAFAKPARSCSAKQEWLGDVMAIPTGGGLHGPPCSFAQSCTFEVSSNTLTCSHIYQTKDLEGLQGLK